MTNRDLIKMLLYTDLDAPVDLERTTGYEIKFKPPVIGKWVRIGQLKVACSICEAKVSVPAAASMNYCFKCGAKMDGLTDSIQQP